MDLPKNAQVMALLASACVPPSPPEEPSDPGAPPPYDSAPGLRLTPRPARLEPVRRSHPPRLGEEVLVVWEVGGEVVLPLDKALIRAHALGRAALLQGPDFEGEIAKDGSWSIRRARG